ncbi:MAG: efflux RND transporter periplasmic adaptor subunit [Chitinophagaceae bacterium]|nr:efflux RND transporter periplasmic adaptor subunit [Chitinophagaceae bacterium]
MKKIIIITGVVLLISCGSKQNQEKTATVTPNENIVTLTKGQMESAKIGLGSLEKKKLSTTLVVNGKIDVPPQNMVSVSMPLGGYLKYTKLLPGLQIRKGEVIAIMEDQQYIQLQQDFLTAKSNLVYSEAEYLRQKELNQSKASSDKVFQQAQMEYTNQKITVSALAEKLKLININPQTISESNLSKSVTIYSPINGFVSKVNVNIGKYVNPSDILFDLVNPSDIHLNLKVFEKDIDKLFIGQRLLAYTNNEPEKKHLCEISLISRDLSAERTAEVHCHFDQYDKTLLPGMYMNAELKIKSLSSMTIAEEAIINFEGGNYVFVAGPANQFTMTAIETGIKENGFIEIKNNRTFTGKQIVTRGAYTLLMALKNKTEE